jgi:hypothetical protein
MQMRTFYSVLNLLAYGINVPPEDEEEGRAFTKASYDKAVSEGRAVDLSNKFVVHSSKGKRPENAFVAVKHRGTWFYVDDRDHVVQALLQCSLRPLQYGDRPLGWRRGANPDDASEIDCAIKTRNKDKV